MGGFRVISYLTLTFFISRADGLKTYRDMFAHKHAEKFPPIPGWFPDGNMWDDNLYPPFGPRDRITRRKGKHVSVHLTSDSPAIQGSCVTFTAALEYPKCQKEDASGNLMYDEHCEDSTEASANGQVRTGYVYNWTSWLDDYGFGRCLDASRCNVFPDGRPFPQDNDWRHRSYVYVWHTMGQYYETCSGSSSSLTLNTSGVGVGAGMMEVLVYRTREHRKYSPTATDNGVYFITDTIPLAVNLSQKQALNLSADVFVRGADVVFDVLLHDPSSYLKTAAAVEYIWDFNDGNQLVTHSNVATHTYGGLGNVTVTLLVKATFPVPCVLTTPTGKPTETHTVTGKVGPTSAATIQKTTATSPVTTAGVPTTTSAKAPTMADVRTAFSTTEAPPPTAAARKTPAVGPSGTEHAPEQRDSTALPLLRQRPLQDTECYRYLYGSFQKEILIVDRKLAVQSVTASKIVDVSAAKMSDSTVRFQVKCTGSSPISACTIVSDALCQQVENIVCDDVPSSPECEVTIRRSFLQPGTYCVNITLQGGASLALASTHVTIQPHDTVSTGPQTVEVVLCTTSVLLAIFGFIAFTVYRRNKVYRLVRRSPRETEEGGVWLHIRRLGSSPYPANQERSRLLSGRPPL